jgi:hypothetical protein
MADKQAQVAASEGKVVRVETQHFIKLISAEYGNVNRPIKDRDAVGRIDSAYKRYQLFTRVIVVVEYNGKQERLRSSPMDESEVIDNPAAE